MRRLIIIFAICVPAVAGASILVTPNSSTTFTAQVGQTSPGQNFTVEETRRLVGDNDETVTLSYAGACGDFTVTPASVEVDNECENDGCPAAAPCIEPVAPVIECFPDNASLSVTFHPSVAATESCTVTLTGSLGAAAVTLSLSGTGTPPPIHVSASPGSIAFGGVRTETTSSPVGVTVTNSGGSPATISSITASGAGYAIASGTTGSHSLNAGASEGLTVTCSPGATVGALGNGALTISSNDPSNPTISIPLSCSGITSKVAVSPSPIVIPTTRVGEPVMQTVTLTNTGAATATIVSVTLTGMDMVSAPPANTMLAQNQSTNAVISFDAAAAGSASGNLHVVTDTDPLDIPITADALVTSMSVTPDGEVDFGPVCAGQTKTQMFSLVATAAGPFQLTAVSTPDAPFSVITPTLP
ncbi:MAG TPA: choice-of-anchor D domain-containing protein, partial [Kofleriaceae bacterium]|nr:choice-of-anchor D domain-containing protein [Kofleriaceae bacterium]